jgi:hypothetical protein
MGTSSPRFEPSFPVCKIAQTPQQRHSIASPEAGMSQQENNCGPRAFASEMAADHKHSAPMPGERIEPELKALTSESVPVNADPAKRDDLLISGNKMEIKEFFVIQNWHRPYAEALLEAGSAELPALIAVAEREILTRYLELSVSPVRTYESLDLLHAVDALSQLKKANAIAHARQQFVA